MCRMAECDMFLEIIQWLSCYTPIFWWLCQQINDYISKSVYLFTNNLQIWEEVIIFALFFDHYTNN